MLEKLLTLTPVDNILSMLETFSTLPAEHVHLDTCMGRVLAADVISPEDVPGANRSTVDGYAVVASDVFGASEGLPALLTCVGECRMGEVPTQHILPGQTMRIWTGGVLPKGSNAVVMVEYTQPMGANHVEIMRPLAPLDNVIEKAQDAACGETVLPKGHTLRVQDIGILAALGFEMVSVVQKPKVAIISSGDEVIPVSASPNPGQVRNVNGHTLLCHALSCGAEARFFEHVPDDPERLKQAIANALEWANIVLISGGSSVGNRDFTLGAVTAQPGSKLMAHGVAVSPGKPLIFARAGEKSIWGMPGHVASALVCADVFIRPLIHRLTGVKNATPLWAKHITARMARSVASAQGRRDYIRVVLEPTGDSKVPLSAVPVRGKSGLISTLVKADGLVVCPESLEGLEQGQEVVVQVFSTPGSAL